MLSPTAATRLPLEVKVDRIGLEPPRAEGDGQRLVSSQREGGRGWEGPPRYCTEPVPERSPAPVGLADLTLLTSLRAHFCSALCSAS